ncbi:hypothetical protein EZS27_000311 [termite gut metagenome]|uniref:Uncharacterized protein n=1 Tax=termite gut metagenome TaxID=433724 RepID=A0A5J4T3T4_9ZZZZ
MYEVIIHTGYEFSRTKILKNLILSLKVRNKSNLRISFTLNHSEKLFTALTNLISSFSVCAAERKFVSNCEGEI